MTPKAIVQHAEAVGIDVLGITDHNSTRQVALVKELAERKGIFVLQGVEVTSKEEVHCLCFFPSAQALHVFQDYIDRHLPHIPNRPGLFGDQVQINENEEIVYEEKRLLLSAINQSIEKIEQCVHSLGGLFIPAHINRQRYGLCTQLGFVPASIKVDALEIYPNMPLPEDLPQGVHLLQNSDAHRLSQIGQRSNLIAIESVSFESIKHFLKDNENAAYH